MKLAGAGSPKPAYKSLKLAPSDASMVTRQGLTQHLPEFERKLVPKGEIHLQRCRAHTYHPNPRHIPFVFEVLRNARNIFRNSSEN